MQVVSNSILQSRLNNDLSNARYFAYHTVSSITRSFTLHFSHSEASQKKVHDSLLHAPLFQGVV